VSSESDSRNTALAANVEPATLCAPDRPALPPAPSTSRPEHTTTRCSFLRAIYRISLTRSADDEAAGGNPHRRLMTREMKVGAGPLRSPRFRGLAPVTVHAGADLNPRPPGYEIVRARSVRCSTALSGELLCSEIS
jgi:hypothetical protein